MKISIVKATTKKMLLNFFSSIQILRFGASSCGLITKSDAQRLCSWLLRQSPSASLSAAKDSAPEGPSTTTTATATATATPASKDWLRVYHECFGRCEGVCRPELYASAGAACVECVECGQLLAPADFVSHAHRSLENRTCHWGFDAAHWRTYLLLARRGQPAHLRHEQLVRRLDEFKSRFLHLHTAAAAAANNSNNNSNNNNKRKPSVRRPRSSSFSARFSFSIEASIKAATWRT